MSFPVDILLSEPDYPIRYAIWRLCALARRHGPLADEARRMSFAVSSSVDGPGSAVPTLMIEGRAGKILEQVFCEEIHETFISVETLQRFLARAARARARPATTDAPCRWVTNARLLRLSGEERVWNLADVGDRLEVLARASLDHLDGEHVVWDDLGSHNVTRLTAESLFYLASGSTKDDRETYQDLYESFRAQLQEYAPERDRNLQQSLLLYLYGERTDREPSLIDTPGEVAFWRQDLLPGESKLPPRSIDPERIATALRRGLFPETEVTLQQIYVPQKANLTVPDDDRKRSLLWSGEAHELLFWWLAEARRRPPKPLLVLGTFGSGKSSLLTVFAQALIETASSTIPLLIPLRDLTGASTAQPLKQVLVEHVRSRWDVDLDSPPPNRRYCLLCDGFDELNLYYRALDSQQWVSECFRSLCVLAEHAELELVISSRPVLLMDVTRREYEGAECPRMDLELFDRSEIEQWCVNYRRAADLEEFLSADQLEKRDLFEVARTPLILYMMARLYEFEETAFREPRRYTRAEIYRRFVDWTQSGGYQGDETKHELPRNYRHILQDIGRYFFQKDDGFVDEAHLLENLRTVHGEKLDHIPIDRNILVAHMLQPVEGPSHGDHHLIEFTHQSFREYLMAEWLWERLAAARRGEGLDPGLWSEMSHKSIPTNEVGFLAEMISELPWPEALALYHSLEDTDNIHQYWIKWLTPTWNELRSELQLKNLESVVQKVGLTATRACNLATLGFLLRAKSYARLDELTRTTKAPKLPNPLAAENLDRLLHLLKTFPSQGVGGDNLAVLLANLQGLVLSGTAVMSHQLNHPDLRDSRLGGINFSGSRWLEADLRGADLSQASFNYCLLTLKATEGASFVGTNFSDAILTHPERERIVGADFSTASFHRTRFLDVTLVESRFVDNRWDGAERLHSEENRPSALIRCELDEAAERFFSGTGFALEECLQASP